MDAYLGKDCLIKGTFPASDTLPEGGEACLYVSPTDMADTTKKSGAINFIQCGQVDAKRGR